MNTIENALPLPPTLFAEIVLLFDHDFPIEQVNSLLGMKPTEYKRQSQTRINPITQKNNPGFWMFQTMAISSFDVTPLLLQIESFFSNHTSRLNDVIQQYSPSCLILRIRVLIHQEDEYPAIRFNPGILQLLSSFNVSIEIDIENDFDVCLTEATEQKDGSIILSGSTGDGSTGGSSVISSGESDDNKA